MNDLAGIIRKEGELEEALAKIDELKARYANVVVEGGRISSRPSSSPNSRSTTPTPN